MTQHTIPLQPMRPDAVTVISCGDENFTAPTGVLFRSIMDHAEPGRFYDLIYLHNGIDFFLLEQLCAMAEGYEHISIRTCDIRAVFSTEGLYVENRKDFSPMTFARLVIPEVLDTAYHRVLYLDGDMIALRDVAELFGSDLNGKALGSSVDFGFLSEVFASRELQSYAKEVIGLEKPDDYFMAAVLLMDLDVLRSAFPAGMLMKTARSRPWNWHDQDVLNHLLHGKIQYFDPAWDVIVPDNGVDDLPKYWKKVYERALASPCLFHFAGNHAKPWTSCNCCYAPEFWEIAWRTPFYERLFSQLCSQESTYSRLYDTPKGKLRCIFRKLLPPPARSVQRDLRNLLDRLDAQTRTLLMLMRQVWDSTPSPFAEAPAREASLPIPPVWEDAMTLVCCGDETFAAPTGVLIQSVIDHADPGRFYDILYLHNGLCDSSRNKLCAMCADYPNISIRTCDIRPIFDENELYTQNRPRFSSMAYARLLIPDILSHSYNRALYLDGDMLAFRDIATLFDSDLEGNPLGAAVDPYLVALSKGRTMSDIISGMLVMDLEQFRQKKLSAKLMEAARSRKWQRHDQDVLNHVLQGQIHLLDLSWNCCDIGVLAHDLPNDFLQAYRQAIADPAIFHFAGSGAKPWERTCPSRAENFWTVAAKTSFYPHLLRRLHLNLNTYLTHYCAEGGNVPMFKRLLKKILPPPVESVQRDLKTVLEAMDEQKRLNLLLMRQIEDLRDAAPSGTPYLAAKVPHHKLRFEFALAAHCNLNCAGCSHFSPLAREEFPDFEESKRSFQRLSQLFGGECAYIHLLGGEPLLNPRCEDYLRLARDCFSKGDIFLVTNGLLLPKQPDSFYETCREAQITIALTPYPISLDQHGIREKCAAFGVKFELFGEDKTKTHFNRLLLDPSGIQDPVENYRRCPYSNVCLFLYKGRMYPCGIGAHMRIFEQHFSAGLELCEQDSVDIFSVRNGYDLLYQLAKPVPMCRYCHIDRWQELTQWERSNKDIQEWV